MEDNAIKGNQEIQQIITVIDLKNYIMALLLVVSLSSELGLIL